jgi:hypothetical protein
MRVAARQQLERRAVAWGHRARPAPQCGIELSQRAPVSPHPLPPSPAEGLRGERILSSIESGSSMASPATASVMCIINHHIRI